VCVSFALQHQLAYFKDAGWELDWIDTAEGIVHTEFEQLYAHHWDGAQEEILTGETPTAEVCH